MNSEEPSEFYEYKDTEMSARLPNYLRPKKGIRFFSGRSKKDSHHALLSIAIELPNEDLTKATWSTIMNATPSDWMGVQQRIVRRGKPSYLTDGLELLHSSHNTVTGDVHHTYDILFLVDSRHIYATFFGQGELPIFEELCRQIVSSIRLVERGSEPPAATGRRSPSGGLGRADKTKLTKALAELPPEIAYLRDPILAIAKEDQDLLGSGEGDIGAVERALQGIAKPRAIKSIAKAHAERLHEWLMSFPGHDGAWAAPAWFVEGVLRGRALFGGEP